VTDRARIIQSFVARIWLERGANGDPRWRGHIQHIQGQEEIYFQDLAQLCEFLEQVSGIPAPEFSTAAGKDANDCPFDDGTRKADKRGNN
jgi:hypothetical protein